MIPVGHLIGRNWLYHTEYQRGEARGFIGKRREAAPSGWRRPGLAKEENLSQKRKRNHPVARKTRSYPRGPAHPLYIKNPLYGGGRGYDHHNIMAGGKSKAFLT